MDEAVELLEATLAEEKETDEKLTEIASELNLVAV
jgi:ferritin-like metal-binding protein YciE